MPPGLPHTPWRLVEHMRIAQWDILRFSIDPAHVSPEFPRGYWPEGDAPPDIGAWDRSIASFRADLKAMKDLVADPKSDLFTPFPHGQGQTLLREALLVADHNAYHLGSSSPSGACSERGPMRRDRRSSGAQFSARRRYRYSLWRVWEPALGCCNFLMLNPSTADEMTDDPTVAHCQRRAERWGFGGLVVTNLFAFRTSDPATLHRARGIPVGPGNDASHYRGSSGRGDGPLRLGQPRHCLGRAAAVRALLAELEANPFCLADTKHREPAHPLYFGYDRASVAMAPGAGSSRPGSG